ncbi:MAG: hypothetical protein IPK50_14860 [Fibrobacterota bacterium]|nr:hypothetical protein [Fibrobacterota bacterium]QQS03573.1 MAG: hypothetical protein IPK50_14860 [Fibrobacterota bacterium]
MESSAVSARRAATQPSFETEHFVFWWETTGEHAITGTAAQVPAGDNIPRLVRVVSTAMEKAWRLYVDTLGYLPPLGMSTSYGWRLPVPTGKVPVEFGNVVTLAKYNASSGFVYGISGPESGGASGIVLAANLTKAPNWQFVKDLDGRPLGSDYERDWELAMQATASHELFHSVQFRYDIEVNSNILFEASAVAMERKAVPEETDYLSFLGNPESGSSLGLTKLGMLPSIFEAVGSYEHAWYVTQLMQDRGVDVVRWLWEFNKANKTSFQKALRTVLRNNGWSLDSSLLRFAWQLGRTGKRSGWLVPGLAGFPDASMFPRLTGTLPVASSSVFSLQSGGIQEWVDTTSPSAERLVVWLPEPGVSMARSFATPSGFGGEICRGSVRLHGRDRARNVWSIANAGPPESLPSSTSTSAKLRLSVVPAPDSVLAQTGVPFSWTDPSGVRLTGNSTVTGGVTPLAHLDVWRPDPAIEDWAARAVASGGHALILEDADRRLALSNAVLKVPYIPEQIYTGTGNGIWAPVAFREVSGGAEIPLGELNLSSPMRVLVSAEGAPRSKAMEARGNPSRGGAPIHFPLDGATDRALLQIIAQDGSCVRRIRSQWGRSEVVWDVRNESGERVRPGVYWYIWENVIGARKGTLLVGD